MSRLCQSIFCLATVTVVMVAGAQIAPPGPPPVPGRTTAAPTNLFPPVPVVQSPVNFFRQLLLMSPAERAKSLAGRSPEARARILAKIREYQALGPDERELRLRATELRWYLLPLLRTTPADREALLAQVPPELQDLVKSRLAQWDILPPPLHEEFLANEKTLHYFTQPPAPLASNSVPDSVTARFNQFMDLTPAEKQHLLSTLSEAERNQMEKTLKAFDGLPARQRVQCVRNYAKFAGMTVAERTEFLKNAEKWSQMSPQERQTWRDLVDHVPLWPPLPTSPPPMPPTGVPKVIRVGMAATN